jgi:hypothetical protein
MRPAAAMFALAATAALAHGQVTIPNEFETDSSRFDPLFAYFGGVASFSTTVSNTTIHSGRSLQCTANFRHDNIFRVAGFAVGTLGITRAAGGLGYAADADTFSITIQSPPAPYVSGQLQLNVAIREDDDGDGIIDTIENDDQWEADNIPVLAGTHVYNVPIAQLVDSDPFAGNNVRNFSTTGMMALLLTFETRTTYPGGIIETPQTLLIDHVGLYTGAQSLPATRCPGDWNSADGVTVQDLFDFLAQWFAADPLADIYNTGDGVTLSDLFEFLVRWFAPCP